ncbi:hypothetical protein PVK06_000907 [Gossypium arboreum]|uniref:Uncharacterized protein n=1 Tax=Gossypium arboreum TaxID=29729 RepID=A0ABR0QZN2_GOSAR|nr:hypothetical protein PVK06_000907 [Gossypium arboreum]
MTTTPSANSNSIEPSGSVFIGDWIITSFPRHEVVKLDEGTFVQWQQQVRFTLAGYNLAGFLDGIISTLTRFIQALDGGLVTNSSATIFTQQDNLLTS